MIYLLAHLKQVYASLPAHKTLVAEAPFFGIMRSRLGRLVMLATVFIIPFILCAFVLGIIFPTFKAEWLSWRWTAETAFQWTLIAAVGVTGWLLYRQASEALAAIDSGDGDHAISVTGPEDTD
jgi:hypothetical protein